MVTTRLLDICRIVVSLDPDRGPVGPSRRRPQQAAAAHQKLTFDGDTALWTVAIKPDKTADFEQVMKKVHEALLEVRRPAAATAGCRLEGHADRASLLPTGISRTSTSFTPWSAAPTTPSCRRCMTHSLTNARRCMNSTGAPSPRICRWRPDRLLSRPSGAQP